MCWQIPIKFLSKAHYTKYSYIILALSSHQQAIFSDLQLWPPVDLQPLELQLESPDREAVDIFLFRSLAAILRYIMVGQSSRIYTAVMYRILLYDLNCTAL